MPRSSVQARAHALELFLGDPFTPSNAFSFERSVALDEQEAYPAELIERLAHFGYLASYVPRDLGGRLGELDEALETTRALSRRDLTVAIALGQCFLGSLPVWLVGSAAQRQRVAELLLSNRHLALALTEEAHGSDVLASDVTAQKRTEGYALSGRKWLINNGTVARAYAVFACTDPGRTVTGFSLFLVDRERLAPASVTPLPRQRTHGIRGADISGVSFQDCMLPESARIGPEGGGLDWLLRSLLLTRLGCAGFSLGAADTALRIGVDFALGRKLYGGVVWGLAHARETLVRAYVDLLLCEALAISGARLTHVLPEQVSIASGVIKYLIPTTVDALLGRVGTVVGARSYLREGLASGVYQKLVRDHAVVALFDGSTAVNLEGVGLHCLRAAQLASRGRDVEAARPPDLSAVFDVDAELPPLAPERLALMSAGEDAVMAGLARAGATGGLSADARGCLTRLEDHASRERAALVEAAHLGRAALKRSTRLFAAAERYALLYNAAAFAQLLLGSRSSLVPAAQGGAGLEALLIAGLSRVLERLGESSSWMETQALGQVEAQLRAQHRGDGLFSLFPAPLAARGQRSE